MLRRGPGLVLSGVFFFLRCFAVIYVLFLMCNIDKTHVSIQRSSHM